MEIIKLTLGETEDRDICFAEGKFCKDDPFYIFAIASGDLTLLVRSDLSLFELTHQIQDDNDGDFNACNCDVVSWNVEGKYTTNQTAELDMESMIAFCMESDLESYQCWHHDGNEGLYEASESDDGLAFVIVHDLLAKNGFENVRSMVEDEEKVEVLLSILDNAYFDDREENYG